MLESISKEIEKIIKETCELLDSDGQYLLDILYVTATGDLTVDEAYEMITKELKEKKNPFKYD